MKHFLLACLCVAGSLQAQTMADCKARFTSYLNFHGSLNQRVLFEDKAIFVLNSAGQKDIAIYENEIPVLSVFFRKSTLSEQRFLMQQKGLNAFTSAQLDSLRRLYPASGGEAIKKEFALSGIKIAIDPGHFGTTLKEAKAEQKYLYFPNTATPQAGDSILLFESELTYNTARLLRSMLEEKDATVMMTRDEPNHTSFQCTFAQWMKTRKKKVLDSLLANGSMTAAKHKSLMKAPEHTFFWDFFRDYELGNRAKKINAFKPDITVIIHYNVDEKNAPWKKAGTKNFTMAFIGGGFTAGDLNGDDNQMHFLRLLLGDQLNRSEQLSSLLVANFHQRLSIPIAGKEDATYLKDKCLSTPSAGVYCRNLALCRKVNSVLVYGESLYQDNEKECVELMKKDKTLYGIKTGARVESVARSYFEAIMAFLASSF